MKLTFLPLYLAISLVPVIFVACAWWSNRQQTESRRTQQSKARELPVTSRKESNKPLCRSRWAGGALVWTRGARNRKGATNVRFVDDNINEYEAIEMQSLSTDSGKKTTARPPIVVYTEIAMPTKPPPTRTRPRKRHAESWTSNEAHQAPTMKPSTWDRNNYPCGRPMAPSTISSPSRPWWERPDDNDSDSNGNQHSDPVPLFRCNDHRRGRHYSQ